MTTLHQTPDGGLVAYSKGAAEEVLAGCRLAATRRPRVELLTPSDRERIREVEQRMAADGLRVLAVASKSRRDGRGRGIGHDPAGPGRDDGSAAARGARGGADVRGGRHPRR